MPPLLPSHEDRTTQANAGMVQVGLSVAHAGVAAMEGHA
jgi:hypothetical protein